MFEPKNEMGVVFLFSQLCNNSDSLELVSIQAAYPDAVIRLNGCVYQVEFEYISSNFITHRHDPRECDLIVCWINDLEEGLPLTIWELCKETISLDVIKHDATEKELAFLRAENKYLRRRIGIQGPQEKKRDAVYYEIRDYVIETKEADNRIPGAREIARVVGCSASYAHDVLKQLDIQ